ncbi:MAG: HD domain-containing protein, partial [Gemmataceae bacterium]
LSVDLTETQRQALVWAAWLHDVVYDPRGADNERQSADWAKECLLPCGVPAELIAEVESAILATDHRSEPAFATIPLIDADLAILGAAPARYDRYAAAIRAEYAWVPEAEYRTGRAKILQGFLDRPRIYQSARLWEEGEAAARENILRELSQLTVQN